MADSIGQARVNLLSFSQSPSRAAFHLSVPYHNIRNGVQIHEPKMIWQLFHYNTLGSSTLGTECSRVLAAADEAQI